MDERRGEFLGLFGALFSAQEWSSSELEGLLESVRYRELAAGELLLREGESCRAVPFVMRGSIRVYKTAESGREICLYHIGPGESCILSSGCSAGIEAFPATVAADAATRTALLPAPAVRRMLDGSSAFRNFVLAQYSRRMANVIELVEEVAFRRVDQRLREWLATRAAETGRVKATHQEMADRLGTSREVVSRILKDWELQGYLEISRGEVSLLKSFESLAL